MKSKLILDKKTVLLDGDKYCSCPQGNCTFAQYKKAVTDSKSAAEQVGGFPWTRVVLESNGWDWVLCAKVGGATLTIKETSFGIGQTSPNYIATVTIKTTLGVLDGLITAKSLDDAVIKIYEMAFAFSDNAETTYSEILKLLAL